jgi:uncharacterized protein YcaQ
MPHPSPVSISQLRARRLWLRAQRLDTPEPFGSGPAATQAAVRHLGYVQIDTIHVIERSHHHILQTRIPGYERAHLHQAQSIDKAVFEYWTHAMSYVPTEDLRYFVRAMKYDWHRRSAWFSVVNPRDLRRVIARIRRYGALTIRDIEDDVLVEKDHEWASRKPSKRALQLAFFKGILTVSRRSGMVKTYELLTRHFGWERLPTAASESEITGYKLDRALRSQGVVSLDSACHLDAARKPAMRRVIEHRVKRGQLVPVAIEGAGKTEHWACPATLDEAIEVPGIVHLLSPFDPLIIQRKRLKLLFGYDHLFEAYLPKHKRVIGYFALPVLVGDEIVAALDLKTDREGRTLLLQNWHWIAKRMRRRELRTRIDEALHRFERFQLAG